MDRIMESDDSGLLIVEAEEDLIMAQVNEEAINANVLGHEGQYCTICYAKQIDVVN